MKAILTVIGKDKVGIISGVSSSLFELNINILDVTQTIMDNYFTMIMMLDLSNASSNFDTIKDTLTVKGNELSVEIKIQREDIFNAMHVL